MFTGIYKIADTVIEIRSVYEGIHIYCQDYRWDSPAEVVITTSEEEIEYEQIKSDDLNIHFIGKLQTNKVKYIIDKVCMIHSLDSLKLAEQINKQAEKRGVVMDVLVEINSGEEENKSGVMPDEAEALCRELGKFKSINLRGFMTMAPKCEKKEDYCKYFCKTDQLVLDIWTKKLHNIGRPIISMGMSESFEEAIAEGSDIVRVGRSMFVK